MNSKDHLPCTDRIPTDNTNLWKGRAGFPGEITKHIQVKSRQIALLMKGRKRLPGEASSLIRSCIILVLTFSTLCNIDSLTPQEITSAMTWSYLTSGEVSQGKRWICTLQSSFRKKHKVNSFVQYWHWRLTQFWTILTLKAYKKCITKNNVNSNVYRTHNHWFNSLIFCSLMLRLLS